MRSRRALLILSLLMSGVTAGASGTASAQPTSAAERSLREVARISAFDVGGGDSLFVDEAWPEIAMAGRSVGMIFPRMGRIVLYDLGTGDVRLLGRPGQGPGDVPKIARALAISTAGVLAFIDAAASRTLLIAMDTSGNELWRKRLVEEAALEQPVQIDGAGNVYLATQRRIPVPVRPGAQPDSMIVTIHRFSRDGRDSAATLPLRTARPLLFSSRPGSVGSAQLTSLYTYAGDVGRLMWHVDSTGRIHLARSDRFGIDTTRIGGGRGERGNRGVLVAEIAAASMRVSDELILTELKRFRVPPELVRQLQPARVARTTRLLSNGRDLLLQRPAFRADGAFDPGRNSVDAYDSAGTLRYTITGPFANAMGTSEFAAISYDRDTETRHLVILQPSVASPPLAPPRAARRPSP